MFRKLILANVAVAALVVLALAIAGPGAAHRGTSDQQLLSMYQPVLVFHPGEKFRPAKVGTFVQDSELEKFVGSSPQQLPLDAFWSVVDADPDANELPPPTPGVFYRLDQTGCEADAALAGRDCYAAAAARDRRADIYGRAVRTGTRIVLQYWLFYYDNPLILPPTPVGTFWQSHEGDWELVNVVLDSDETPLEAAYSQHCSGQRKAWSGVTKSPSGSTHPVAYVALGSHANYFAPGAGSLGSIPINPACIPAGDCADPADAPVPPGRRPGARRLGRRRCRRPARERLPAGEHQPDRGQGLVDVRRALGRVGVLLHADPAGADPRRSGARRARTRESCEPADLERRHDPQLAGGAVTPTH